MANLIQIKTQPTSVSVREFGNTSISIEVSGSGDDTTSYLDAEIQWFRSGSWTALSSSVGPTSTYSFTNVQETSNGFKYLATVNSASAADTLLTSSVATLTVIDPEIPFDGIDKAPTAIGKYSGLGLGYSSYITLLVSGSAIPEQLCPHFVDRHDLQKFINKEVAAGGFTTTPKGGTTAGKRVRRYNGVTVADTENNTYSEMGYKVWIPIYASGSQMDERYCPHFISKAEMFNWIDNQLESSAFTASIGA